MRITYNEEMDVLRFLLKDVPIEESDEVADGLIVDYDAAGNTVGMELLDASKHLADPRAATSGYSALK